MGELVLSPLGEGKCRGFCGTHGPLFRNPLQTVYPERPVPMCRPCIEGEVAERQAQAARAAPASSPNGAAATRTQTDPPDPPTAAATRAMLEREHREAVRAELWRQRAREDAREQLAAWRHAQTWQPPGDHGWLSDELGLVDADPEWRVRGLLGVGHNAILVSGRKAGKTTMVDNLVQALVDGEPFLGRFDVTPTPGAVAVFNYEVDERQYRRWLRETDIVNADRVCVLHLRGRPLALADPHVRAWVASWLRERGVSVWIADPWSRLYVGSVDNGNDEAQVGRCLDWLDQIKAEAGVSEFVMPIHTPKAKAEAGEETAIGSQRLEAWPDGIWYLSRDMTSGLRFLRAEGRDVDVAEEQLTYDVSTRLLRMGGWDRATVVKRADADTAVAYVTKHPGASQNDIMIALGWGAAKVKKAIAEAGPRVRVEVGSRGARLHFSTSVDFPAEPAAEPAEHDQQ